MLKHPLLRNDYDSRRLRSKILPPFRLRMLLTLVAAAGLGALSARAQQNSASAALRNNPPGVLKPILPGHYAFTSGTFNSGIIATNEGVVVVDALDSEAVARQEREAIASQIGQPVRFLVSSTFHNNYTKGNVAYADVLRIGTENYRTDLLQLMQHDNVPAEQQTARLPTQTYRDRVTLYLGGKEIQILYPGRAHTRGDSIVFIPQDRIVYMSELFFNAQFPYMDDGYGDSWIKALDAAEALGADMFVPAHGPIPDSPKDSQEALHSARQILVELRDAVQAKIARGATEDQAVAAVKFPQYATLRAYDQQKNVAVRRIYKELKGELP